MAVSVFPFKEDRIPVPSFEKLSGLGTAIVAGGSTGVLSATGRTRGGEPVEYGPIALTIPSEQASLPAMALLRGLFWLVLFAVLAFCFVVLFEYGPRDFANGCKKEFARVKSFVVKQTEKVEKPKKQR